MSGVEIIEVVADEAHIRLDRWFRRHYPAVAHGRLEKLLRTGQIRVDGGRVRSSTRLEPGQKIRIPPLSDNDRKQARRAVSVSGGDAAALRQRIVHMDDDVLAINKPAGLAVQGGTRVGRHLDAMLDALRFDAIDRPRLVHRLDKDTSGVLLLARNSFAASALAESFRTHDAVKTYWALSAGVPKPRRGRIDLALAKKGGRAGERVRAGDGKDAATLYAVVQHAGRKAAWLALRPLTGRTHQLRVHCAAIGTPILGDGKHGGRLAFISGVPNQSRLHLHAYSIDVAHPRSGRLSVYAPLSPEFEETWRFLGFDPESWLDPFIDV